MGVQIFAAIWIISATWLNFKLKSEIFVSLLKTVLNAMQLVKRRMKLVHRFLITVLRNMLYRLRFIEV